MSELQSNSRRKFLKKSAYVVPVVMTLSAAPALAGHGSPKHKKGCNNGVGNGPDCLPPGIDKNGKHYLDNDDKWGTPGNPQNRGGFKNETSKKSNKYSFNSWGNSYSSKNKSGKSGKNHRDD